MNLLRDLPDGRATETTDILVARPGLRIERIVSFGQASPEGYDQDEAEWVLLLTGAASLRFAGRARGAPSWSRRLAGDRGDRRHRVEWTDPAQPTVWLAVFYR
jgi:cupin 2 domain-containing protein